MLFLVIFIPTEVKSDEMLELRLNQEKIIISQACEHFTKIDVKVNSGGCDFLSKDLVAFEEQIASGKSLSCSADEKTKTLIEKINRLEATKIYEKCVVEKECRNILPALQGLEDHFEIRNAQIDGVKIVLDLLNELVPSYAEKAKDVSGNLILENFLFCIQFILSEAPIFYKLLFHSIYENLPSSTDQFFTELNQLVFRILAIIAIFLVFPKIIWRLHLFVMKMIIFLLFLVICLGCYNYILSFGFSFQYLELRGQLEENVLIVKNVDFIESIWGVKEFEAVKIHRNLDAINKVVKHTFTEMKPNVSGFPLKKLEKTYEKIKTELDTMERVGGKDYKDLSIEAKQTYEKFETYLRSLIETLAASQNFYQYIVHGFESLVEVDSLELFQLKQFLKAMITKSQDIEQNFSNHKNKFLYYISDLNKIYKDIKQFEEANEKNVKKAGAFAALAVVVAMPLLGSGAAATLATVGAAGVYYVHNSATDKNKALGNVDNVNKIFKGYTKDTLEILQKIDPAKLRSAISAADTSANQKIEHEDLKYYFEESQGRSRA